jgi:hypothetical protein
MPPATRRSYASFTTNFPQLKISHRCWALRDARASALAAHQLGLLSSLAVSAGPRRATTNRHPDLSPHCPDVLDLCPDVAGTMGDINININININIIINKQQPQQQQQQQRQQLRTLTTTMTNTRALCTMNNRA